MRDRDNMKMQNLRGAGDTKGIMVSNTFNVVEDEVSLKSGRNETKIVHESW